MALEYFIRAADLDLDKGVKERLLETLCNARESDDAGARISFVLFNDVLTVTARYSTNYRTGEIAGRPFASNGACITFRLNKFEYDKAVVEMLRCVNAVLLHCDTDLLFYFIESTQAYLARLGGTLYLRGDDDPRAFWKLLGARSLIELPHQEIPLPFSFD